MLPLFAWVQDGSFGKLPETWFEFAVWIAQAVGFFIMLVFFLLALSGGVATEDEDDEPKKEEKK